MIHKKELCGGAVMLKYVLLGASMGAFLGSLLPPGSLFWFAVGGIGGYITRQYIDYP